MNLAPSRTEPSDPDNNSRKPVGNQSNGPLEWPPGTICSNWKHFHPVLLCSAEGIHMIVSPCDPGWWTKRKIEGTSESGFQFKTALGEFVIEGHSSKDPSPRSSERSIKATAIWKKSNGELVAQFKGRSSIVFKDGAVFTMVRRGSIPLLAHYKYEFVDINGGKQFRIDRKNQIWLTDKTDRNRVLFLIAAERFIREVDSAEALG
jgi:hypothetical protein